MIPTWFKDRAGNIYLNDLLRYVKSTFITPAQNNLPIAIAAAPSATIPRLSTPIIIEGGEDSVSELLSFIGIQGAAVLAEVDTRMTVTITDLAYRRNLMNRSIPVRQVFGTRLQPFFLHESTFLEQQQVMSFQFFNNSTLGATSFEFMIEAGKYQSSVLANPQVTNLIKELRRRKLFLTPFWFTSNERIQLGIGETRLAFFTGSKDAILFLFSIMAEVVVTGGASIQDNFEFELFDAKTQRPLQNRPILQSVGTGNARFPHPLPTALFVDPYTTIMMRIRNLNPAAIEVFFTFAGVSDYVHASQLLTSGVPEMPVPEPYSVGAR